jgi:integrase
LILRPFSPRTHFFQNNWSVGSHCCRALGFRGAENGRRHRLNRVLYVLLGATGMRISEALAIETQHFVNEARTVKVEQQVDKDAPRIAKYLKTDTAHREIDLHPDVACTAKGR